MRAPAIFLSSPSPGPSWPMRLACLALLSPLLAQAQSPSAPDATRADAPTAPLPESAVFQSQGKEENTVNKTIHIDGMMCTHCTGRVEKALNDLPGVEATVDLDSKSAEIGRAHV